MEKETRAMLHQKIYGTSKKSEILDIFKRDVAKIKTEKDINIIAKKYLPYAYMLNSIDMISQKLNEFRAIIKGLDIPKKTAENVTNLFQAPVGFYDVLDELRIKRLKEKQNNKNDDTKIKFDLAKFDKIVEDLYAMGTDKELKNYNYKLGSKQTKEDIRAYYLATYLALVSGRRLTEILKTMVLRKYKGKAKIKGLLKKGKENLEEVFDLIILDDVNKIVTAYKELREIFDTKRYTIREVNNKFNNRFNKFLKEKIFDDLDDISFHDLRKIYLLETYKRFAKKENETLDMWAEKALLHDIKLTEMTDFNTQVRHYTTAKIVDKKA